MSKCEGMPARSRKYGYILIVLLVVFVVFGSLFDFNRILTLNEIKRAKRDLTWSAKQSALVVQSNIEQYFMVLEKDAVVLERKDLSTGRELLEQIRELPKMDFDFLGIADVNGKAVLTTGEEFQVQEFDFFKETLAGNNYISDWEKEGEYASIIAVPLYERSGEIKGTLFGEILLKDMNLFSQFEQLQDEKQSKYMCLVDKDGNFIIKYGTKSQKTDLADILGNCTFDRENWEISSQRQIMQEMEKSNDILFAIKSWNRSEIVAMVPIAESGWYLYDVTDREYVNQEIRYYQKDMIYLTVKILVMFVLLLGVYIYYNVKERKKIRNLYTELSLNEETYRVTVENSSQCIFTYHEREKEIQFMNDRYKDFGLPKQCVDLSWVLDTLKKDSVSAYQRVARVATSVSNGEARIERELFVRINGENHFLLVQMVNLFDEKGQAVRSIGSLEDITEQKENAMLMRREQEFRKSLLADCLGYLEVNLNEDIILENSYGYGDSDGVESSFTEAINTYIDKKVLPEYREEMRLRMSRQAILERCQSGISDTVLEYQTTEVDGNIYWIACDIRTKQSDDGNDKIAYLVYRNVDAKKKEQLELEKEATQDAMTGALKRKPAKEKINQMIKKPLAKGHCHVFLLLDMDNFKTLNDTLGHMCGDRALIDFVATAKKNCRKDDIICRLGGDEFVIFLKNVSEDSVTKKIESLQEEFRTAYEKDGAVVMISVSIGVVMVYHSEKSFDELYDAADKALYKAKKSKKGTYCIAD